MKSLNRFHEASLPKIEDFYSNVNMRDIADPDYNLEIKLGKKIQVSILNCSFRMIRFNSQMHLKI